MQLWPDPSQTIAGIGTSIRNGRSCVEVIESYLARIHEHDAHLQAWVIVDRDGALDTAAERHRELVAGNDRGPLHGIPVGIKDIIDVKSLPTTAGYEPWRDRIAECDAPLVARLRDAGAVIIGKTVTTQFACFDPAETRNPWNEHHTPGGSSSGSAAAVASGMCPAAIGTQTGGSINRPASYCGVVGFKPTFDHVPMQGIVPVAKSLDHAGPITRCVDDAAIVFAALSGEPIQHQHDVPLRIGCLRGFSDSPMTSVIEAIDVTLPIDFDQAIQHHRTIMLAEAVRAHGNLPAVSLKPGIRGLLDEGRTISDSTYRNSIDYQQQLRLRVEKEWPSVDALLMPATTGPPPDTSSTGDPRFNSPWSLLGLPAVSLPVSLDENGLPQSLQLVGRAGRDKQLLSIAHHVETQLQHRCTRWQSQ